MSDEQEGKIIILDTPEGRSGILSKVALGHAIITSKDSIPFNPIDMDFHKVMRHLNDIQFTQLPDEVHPQEQIKREKSWFRKFEKKRF